MKRTVWKHVLSMTLAVVLVCTVTACSPKETIEATEAPREEEPAPPADTTDEKEVIIKVEEESSYLLSILKEQGDGTYSACGMDGTDYSLSLSSRFPEKDRALLVPQAVLTVTALTPEAGMTQDMVNLDITSAKAMEETLETLELRQAAFEKIHGFRVDESISASMYANRHVNVRKGPSTDYEKTGSLSFAQEVTVTGMADTGWYQISYNGESAYVSDRYLGTEKPALPGAPSAGGNSAPAQGGSLDAASLSLPYTEAEIDAAMNSGDLEKAWAMNQANLSALNGSPSTGGSSGSTAGTSTPMEKSTSTSSTFISYMNSQRASAGLSELAWSDSLAATAQARAEEIVNDFSHNGSRNCSGEIITQSSSSDEAAWYANFYNSPGHRAHMLDEGLYTRAGAAACRYGDRYYVVVLFDYTDR